jgi:tellurite resistance protein
MNEILRKKLNLLVHLANVDGSFESSEREVLVSMLKETGEPDMKYPESVDHVELNDFTDSKISKHDILYWALRLIKADGIIHADEAAYCKALAVKLNYKPEVVDFFVSNDLGNRQEFKKKSLEFSSKSA